MSSETAIDEGMAAARRSQVWHSLYAAVQHGFKDAWRGSTGSVYLFTRITDEVIKAYDQAVGYSERRCNHIESLLLKQAMVESQPPLVIGLGDVYSRSPAACALDDVRKLNDMTAKIDWAEAAKQKYRHIFWRFYWRT